MQLARFYEMVADEFGSPQGEWLLHSHVLAQLGGTPEELIEQGVSLKEIWRELCRDFEVPPERFYGRDLGNPKIE